MIQQEIYKIQSVHEPAFSVSPSMLTRRTEMELESTRESTGSATAATAAIEELRERMTTAEAAALEGVPSLASHGIVRVITVVEALTELGVREDLVRLVDRRHLSFRPALVGMC